MVLSTAVCTATTLVIISLSILAFQFAYRRNAVFNYYAHVAGFTLAVTLCCIVGVIVGPFMYLINRQGTVNYIVARTMSKIGPLLCGISVKVEGNDILNTTNVPAVFVANHQSSLDILSLGLIFPDKVAIMAKKSIKYVPLLGWFMAVGNNVFVDRKNRESAMETMAKVAVFLKEHQYGLWLFPEGTRSHQTDNSLLPFKKGAFHLAVQGQIPVVPIVFSTYAPCYDPTKKLFRAGVITVKVLEPIETIGMTTADVDTLLERTRTNMLQALTTIKTVPAEAVKTKKRQ
ncbi:hypothetical protein DFJ77DRAFT_509066 [Powellomyces hirtus]|nr:hypothetical protein DFJ77DRAFT_509066 [Powellomyces hirtus]